MPKNLVTILKEGSVQFDHAKVVIVLPAYNAEKTLKQTLDEIPEEFREHVILAGTGYRRD